MTRALLSLFALDGTALSAFEAELRDALSRDDRDAVVALLGLGGSFADVVRGAPRAVDLFLVPETAPDRAGLYASLRRVVKKRALHLLWTSASPALEGRLREYDRVREEPEVARRVDALLDARRVPWFLRRPGATAGALGGSDRQKLAEGLEDLEHRGQGLPDEIVVFAKALDEAEGDVLCHDGLG